MPWRLPSIYGIIPQFLPILGTLAPAPGVRWQLDAKNQAATADAAR